MTKLPTTVQMKPARRDRRGVVRSHFDLDQGMPVDEMPWLHWVTLRLGEGMLALLIAGAGYGIWNLGTSAAHAAASFTLIG
jgi:hypothetical protein